MRIIVVLVTIGLAVVASAGARKVLVLPLDGNAPAAQRIKLNASVAKMTKKNLTGTVTVGDTTFAETAAAVGCDPKSDTCAQTVLSTLSVDELVYGTATKTGNTTTVELTRVIKGQTPRTQATTIGANDNAEKAEPGLEPLFGASPPPPPPPPPPPLEGSGSSTAGSTVSSEPGAGS